MHSNETSRLDKVGSYCRAAWPGVLGLKTEKKGDVTSTFDSCCLQGPCSFWVLTHHLIPTGLLDPCITHFYGSIPACSGQAADEQDNLQNRKGDWSFCSISCLCLKVRHKKNKTLCDGVPDFLHVTWCHLLVPLGMLSSSSIGRGQMGRRAFRVLIYLQ